MYNTYRHGVALKATAAVGFGIAAALVAAAVVVGSWGAQSVHQPDTAMCTVKGMEWLPATTRTCQSTTNALAAQREQAIGFARVELGRRPTVTTSPYGGLVEFTTGDKQAGDSLTDALKAKYNAHRIRLASLPPYGEG